jgi:2-haloacid dehalogenase
VCIRGRLAFCFRLRNAANMSLPAPRALFFDVFGTLVDWRSGVAREAEALLGALGVQLDWLAFADAWRAEYQPAMERVRSGNLPYRKLDSLHRENLERVLPRFGITSCDEPTLEALNRAWHRLDAWPDVAAGLRRLELEFWIAPVSNGHIALMVALARRNGFVWSAVLGAELAGDYKPKRQVYERACDAFDLAPHECMMVAAHADDLRAAGSAGLRTAFVARPLEYGRGQASELPDAGFDVMATGIDDLAGQLGA